MIEIPFVFTARVTTSKGRDEDKKYRALFEMDIRTVPVDETTVVLRHRGLMKDLYIRGTTPPMVDIRLYEGGIYEPARHSVYRHDAPNHEDIVFVADDWDEELIKSHVVNMIKPQHAFFQQDDVKEMRYPRPERVVESDRDELTEKVKSIAEEFVMIGGVLHRRVPEPVLLAASSGVSLISSIAATLRSRGGYDRETRDERHYAYRLDQLDEAIAFSEIVRAEQNGVGGDHRPEYELLDASWLRHEATESIVMGAIHQLQDDVALHLPSLPVPAMKAFCHLRDAIRPRTYVPDFEMDYAAVLDRAEELIDLLRATQQSVKTGIAKATIDRAKNAMQSMTEDLADFRI